MKILAIESSCDETAASVIEATAGRFKILSNVISSQVKVHAQYGGIVPEVAARLHIEKILPVINLALSEALVKDNQTTRQPDNFPQPSFDYLAVCSGPGLISSLAVGVETAKTLAFAFNKPLIKVNHLEGHLLSALLTRQPDNQTTRQLLFPAIGLIVSGGHTQLVLMKDYLKYKIVGQTIDDAAGEAFDKAAKILGLGYPGGPAISAEAAKLSAYQILDTRYQIQLPRPLLNSNNLDFSFSGLKTAILYKWRDLEREIKDEKQLQIARSYMAAAVQDAIIDVLVKKTIKAARQYSAKTIILGGGVSANDALRHEIMKNTKTQLPKVNLLLPEKKLTGDNAAMIALAAYYHARKKDFTNPFNLTANPNWSL